MVLSAGPVWPPPAPLPRPPRPAPSPRWGVGGGAAPSGAAPSGAAPAAAPRPAPAVPAAAPAPPRAAPAPPPRPDGFGTPSSLAVAVSAREAPTDAVLFAGPSIVTAGPLF